MNFKISKNGIEESFWNSTEKITTPSLAVSKNGSKYYIPLFEASGSEITYGDYIYTLSSRFKIGSKKPALSRVIANHSPSVQILSYPSNITDGVISSDNPVKFTVTDIDNDLLTVTIYCTKNEPTPGSAFNFYQTAIKTYENVSSGTTISFSGYVPESGAAGYSNAGDYILRVGVTDSKGASSTSKDIHIYKNSWFVWINCFLG